MSQAVLGAELIETGGSELTGMPEPPAALAPPLLGAPEAGVLALPPSVVAALAPPAAAVPIDCAEDAQPTS
jgi:hypothetical protein